MTEKLVYLLSTHQDDGSENVHATLNREKLPDLLHMLVEISDEAKKTLTPAGMERWKDWANRAAASLEKCLAKDDGELIQREPIRLHDGWGGCLLHIVPLYEGED